MHGPNTPKKFDKLAEHYLRIRDHIEELKRKHQEELKEFVEGLDIVKGHINKALTEIGVENVKTSLGTIHFTRRRTAALSDVAAFEDYVIEGQHWELLDWKANSTAVQAFMKDNDGATPPGVRLNTFTDVSVRRGTTSES